MDARTLTPRVGAVIQTYQRPYYIENFVALLAEQMPREDIYIADAGTTNQELLAILRRVERAGSFVAWRAEHCWGDWAKNQGWKWAVERGCDYVLLAEDGVLPGLNLIEETTAVLALHESFWVAAPVMSHTPRLAPLQPFDPGPVPDGRLPDGHPHHDACRVFEFQEAIERMRIFRECGKARSPRWRVVDHLDSVLLVVKRECWETVGLLDDRFGQGFNTDSDYFYRVGSAGGEMVICERTYADHWRDDFNFGIPRESWPGLAGPHLARKYGGAIPPIPCRPREGDD